MTFFSQKEYEVPLTKAVISNDIEAVKCLKASLEERLACNHWGFNGVELAYYLDRKECLAVLEPSSSRRFKVWPRAVSSPVLIDQKKFEELFHVRYLSHLRFDHYELLKKAIQGSPWTPWGSRWLLQVVGIEEEMRQRFITHQSQIAHGFVAKVSIRWIDERLGYGLFAEKHFKEGEYIGEYCGELHPRQILHFTENAYCFQYSCGILPYFFLTINAKYAGNELRFVNHSYTPNMTFKPALDKGLMHVLFFAQKSIKKGDQLTYDYGEDYWVRRGPPVDL